jgi:hypothetical protein
VNHRSGRKNRSCELEAVARIEGAGIGRWRPAVTQGVGGRRVALDAEKRPTRGVG